MLRLAIDFGTSVTKIYKIGSGIVLAEPTCVTVQKETGEIRAFGSEAKRLLGKTAELTDVCFPVYEGEIVDERCASALLEYFLRKVVRRAFSVEALFCVPCACSVASREKYCRVARAAGLSRVSFAETPYLAVLGQDVPLSESNPVFAVDMGAGKTSCAAFSLDGVIAGLTMNVGGNNMDVHIIDHVAETFNLKIGSLTSEKLKIRWAVSLKTTIRAPSSTDGTSPRASRAPSPSLRRTSRSPSASMWTKSSNMPNSF